MDILGGVSGPFRLRKKFVLAVVILLAIVVAGWFSFTSGLTPHQRHRRVLERIQRWTKTHGNPWALPEGSEARGINEVKRAIFTATGNWPLWYPENAPTEKLKAVADYLDRTNGADFSTYASALHVLKLLEDVSPTLHDYPWVEHLREMQDDGEIPKPPPQRTGETPARK